MPKPPKSHPKSRLRRLLKASQRGVGNKLEKRTSGIIELRGFWVHKTTPMSVLKGVTKPLKFCSFFTSFLHDLNGLLAPNMVLKTSQILSKIDVHVRVFLGALLTSDFHRKFVRKWIKPKSAEGIFAWELILFIHFRHVEDLLKIRHDLHPKNLHFASQSRPKINAKTAPREHRNLYRISKRFWKVLGCENDAMLDPCWRPRCHKIRQNSMPETGSQKGSKNNEKIAGNQAP